MGHPWMEIMQAEAGLENHRKEPRFAVCSIGEGLDSHVVKIESMFGLVLLSYVIYCYWTGALLVKGYARLSWDAELRGVFRVGHGIGPKTMILVR